MKKILTVFMAASILLTSVPAQNVYAFNTQNDTSVVNSAVDGEFLLGDGSQTNPYVISTAEHLLNMYKYPYSNFILCRDIDMSGKSYRIPEYFGGSFDGCGYTISNLSLKNSTDIGLVGELSGSITNLTMKLCKLETTAAYGNYAGAFAARVTKTGIIENCKNQGTIVTSEYSHAGGIAGFVEGTITKCSNTSDITAHADQIGNIWSDSSKEAYAGGIAAYATESSTVSTCYNRGNIIGTRGVGGIAGYAYSVKDCFNTGKSQKVAFFNIGNSGGICGTANYVENCYSISDLIVRSGYADNEYNNKIIPIVTNCYYYSLENDSKDEEYGTRLIKEEMMSEQTYAGFDFENVWEMGAGGYRLPSLRGMVYEIDFPIASEAGFQSGTGTFYDPYEIIDANQLVNIKNFPDAYYSLNSDIDLSEHPGAVTDTFNGVLYGNGHTISGAKITGGYYKNSLFGSGAGSISDLTISDSTFESNYDVGLSTIMWYTTGNITNCVNKADVTGLGNAFGIVGSAGNISGCKNYGVITGGSQAAGIASEADKITDCINYANISSGIEKKDSEYAGGIAIFSDVSNCINYGKINTSGTTGMYVGGIIADGKAFHCYNTGSVYLVSESKNGGCYIGGIVGRSTSSVRQCENKGMVQTQTYDGNKINVGGIAGYAAYVYDCCNYGKPSTTIFYNDTTTASYGYVGGIVGYVGYGCENCYNGVNFTIYTKNYYGAIAGGSEAMDYSTCYFTEYYNCGSGIGQGPTGEIVVPNKIGSYFYKSDVDTWETFDFNNVWTIDDLEEFCYGPSIIGFTTQVKAIEFAQSYDAITLLEDTYPKDLSVTVTRDNDEQQTIDLKSYMLDGYDKDKIGTQVLGLNYQGVKSESTITINVCKKEISSIEMDIIPEKLTYIKDEEELDLKGGKLLVNYNNGTKDVIDITQDMVSGYDKSIAGECKVSVSYEDFTTSFNVFVKEPVRINIKSNPRITYYIVGEDVNLNGMKIELVYSDDSTRDIDLSDVTVDYDNTKAGNINMTINACGFTTTCNVWYYEKRIVGCELKEPTNTSCYQGGTLDISDGYITEEYYAALSTTTKKRNVPLTMDMISGFDNSIVGLQTITISYLDYSWSVPVGVIEDTVDLYSFKTFPDKTEYYEGEELDLSGATVEVKYKSGKTEIIDMTKDLINEYCVYDMNAVSTYSIYLKNVTVGINPGQSTFFYITVSHKVVIDEGVDATCTSEGKTPGSHCSICGEIIESQRVIPKKEHTKVIDEGKPATCISEGKTSGSHCSVCGEIIESQSIIPKTGHSWSGWVVTKRATYTAVGEETRTCTECGAKEKRTIAMLKRISIANATVSGITNKYFTGKQVTFSTLRVTVGGKVLKAGTDYTVTYKTNTNIGNGYVQITGKGAYTGYVSRKFAITVKKGAAYTVGSLKYKITKATTDGKGTVAVTAPKSKSITSVSIPSTISLGGVKFKVTSISDKAFSGCSKLKSVTIGSYVTSIGSKAFYKCSSLKKITVNTSVLSKVGSSALSGINAKAVIKVPSKKLKSYSKLFKNNGQKKTVKITK